MKFGKAKQMGIGLIEMVLVLAIIAGIIVGGVGYYRSSVEAQHSNDLASGIHSIQSNVRGLAGGTGSYGAGSLNSVLINNKRIPPTFKPSGATITSPYGSAITVTGAGATFTITVTAATPAECTVLLTNSGNFTSYKVGAAAAVTAVPATLIDADTACAAGGATVILSSV